MYFLNLGVKGLKNVCGSVLDILIESTVDELNVVGVCIGWCKGSCFSKYNSYMESHRIEAIHGRDPHDGPGTEVLMRTAANKLVPSLP